MAHYLCKLIPPRPSFPFDMTEAERLLMQRHAAYLGGLVDQGKVVVYGPVADPAGPWGLGIFDVADEGELKALLAGDPAAQQDTGLHYEILPMLSAVVGRAAGQTTTSS